MKKLLLVLLLIGGLGGTGMSAWYLSTKQTSHTETLKPDVGDFREDIKVEETTETLEEDLENL